MNEEIAITEFYVLAPCPFCGKSFVFSEISDDGVEVRHYNKDCHLEQFIGWFPTKEDAIQKMNARPIEDELRGRVTELYSEIATALGYVDDGEDTLVNFARNLRAESERLAARVKYLEIGDGDDN